MSLTDGVEQGGEKGLVETSQEEMERQAKEFDSLCGHAENKAAIRLYQGLDPETQKYIRESPKYGWRLTAVFKMRGA